MRSNSESTHLDPEEVAAFLDGGLAGPDRDRVAAHLADCEPCRTEIAAVAENLAAGRLRSRRAGWIAVATAAAAAIIYVGPRLSSPDPTDPRVFRASAPSGAASVEIVSPREVMYLKSGTSLIWRAVAEHATYVVDLMTSDATLLWSARTPDTTVSVPSTVPLDTGVHYLLSIQALLPDGRSAVSGTTPFVVRR